jgi:Flp pilus assembly protein TadD
MIVALALTLAQAASQATGPASEAFKFDYVRTKDRIEADGRAQRVLEISVLLRTPTAVSQFGQVAVPYVDGFGDVRFETIHITKPGGEPRVVKDGRLEDLNPFGVNDASIPIDFRVKKLTIPGLEPGDRLSYRLITTLKPFVPGEASGEMKFAPASVEEPQLYELDIPAQSRLRVNLRPGLGVAWQVVSGEEGRLVRRLSVSVPPPVIASTGVTEAQMAAFQEPDVSYTTFASWSDVGRWWWQMSRDQVRGDDSIRKESARIVAGKSTPRDKVEAIASFVGSTIRYLNVSFGMGRMQPRAATAVLASRYGDCKDKVGLVMALADAAGIEVRPVLVDSARLDLRDDAPGPHQFDHVIAAAILGPAEKDWLWLDPTNSLSSPLNLFAGLRDKRAVAIDRQGMGLVVRTPASAPYATSRSLILTGSLESSGVLKGHGRVADRSDNEGLLRGSFASVGVEQHVELAKSLLTSIWSEARISNVRATDPANLVNPFSVEFDFERDLSGIDSEKEWKLWIPDSGPVLFEPSTDVTSRKPVRVDISEFTFRASIEIPEGVQARAPLSVSLERPFASLQSTYTVDGRTLKVERSVRFAQPFVGRDLIQAYDALRKAADTDRKQDFSIGPIKSAAPAAAVLQKEGKAAYAGKEYPKAIELLQKAIAADPKLAAVHFDLGLAFRESKKFEEAVDAYTKAIAADPYHDAVYAERAYALFELKRADDAEKDLLKQIEVAPFKDWSYGRLAQLRNEQKRYLDAADLYSKALAIDGSDVTRWIDAAWAYVRGGKFDESRKAYEKARTMGFKAGQGVRSAFGYRLMGDIRTAALLAQEDVAGVAKNVALITPKNMGSSYLYWVKRLAEAWMLIGEGALESGETAKAERYLKAAWEYGFLPNAAYGLGRIRETQGNPGQAAELWSAAATLGNWESRPSELAPRIDNLRRSKALTDGSQEMTRLRFISIPGGSTVDAEEEEVLLLASGGKVTGAVNSSKRKEAEIAPILTRLIGLPISIAGPDDAPLTLLRAGMLVCSRRSGCQFIARIESGGPGSAIDFGDIAIVKMSPADKSTITAGETVHLVLTVSYNLEGTDPGTVTLVVGSSPTDLLVTPQPTRTIQPGKGTVDFDVTFTAPGNASEVRVFLPLTGKGGATRTVAAAKFTVKR